MIFIATCSSRIIITASTCQLMDASVDFGEISLPDFVLELEYVVGYFLGDRYRLLVGWYRQHSRLAQKHCHFYSIIFDFSVII